MCQVNRQRGLMATRQVRAISVLRRGLFGGAGGVGSGSLAVAAAEARKAITFWAQVANSRPSPMPTVPL